jgi:hypothetical protein
MLRDEVKQVHEIAAEAVKPLAALVQELQARVDKLEKAAVEKPAKGVKDAKL